MFNYTGFTGIVKNYLEIDMPFFPVIPNDHVVPTMRPGHHECAESILIVDIHVILIHTGLAVSIGCTPGCEQSTCLRISHGHSIQHFAGAKNRYGHLMQQLVVDSGLGHLAYITSEIFIHDHSVFIVLAGYCVGHTKDAHESTHVYFRNALVVKRQHQAINCYLDKGV